jgi:S-adenosylmethionine-diacylglycerol 3-amino-3-carboxypropyl transferase
MIRHRNAKERLNTRIFRAVHGRNLIYNTCWEDPALDRTALDFQPDDRVVVITSAGCNALDYLLAGAGEVNAVDVNPIQNALLELKAAAARGLDYRSFYSLFGDGRSLQARQMYGDVLRRQLSVTARAYWDKHINFFVGKGWRKTFYYRGTCGLLAKLVLFNAQKLHRLREPIDRLLNAESIDEQKEVYEAHIRPRMWTPWLRWFLSRSLTLSLLGVPWPQRNEITTQYPGGVPQFIQDCVETVLTRMPLRNNYFWRVYLQGHYDSYSCPEYLKQENFPALKKAIDRLQIHTNTMTGFLEETEPGVSKFVLLDHMDWMSCNNPQGLIDEWNAILRKARPGARVIYRSAGLKVSYLDHLHVRYRGAPRELGGLLRQHTDWAASLHVYDRVHTYGSFYIADLPNGHVGA